MGTRLMYIGTMKATSTRLYMTKDPVIRPRIFTIEDGIQSLNNSQVKSQDVVYDLSGRKVNQTSPNLIYIRNGKKMIK